jgi:hypothetical protein
MHSFAFWLDNLTSANGTAGGHSKDDLLTSATADDRFNDLRNNFTGSLNHDPISYPDVFAMDIFLIMQRRLADNHAPYSDRLQNGIWIKAPGPPHIYADVD